jgi:hypothetical protein
MSKKINLILVGIDGNAYSIMGAFQKQARKEGWKKEEIESVLNEAMSSDYNHLLQTIMSYCENDGFGDYENYGGDEYDNDDDENDGFWH